MAVTGFEGFEKRLELQFAGDDDPLGLRRLLQFESLSMVLSAVQCSVVSAVGNRHLDAYVLSESSLFVYPDKIIIKTCGTTQLLKSIPCLLHLAAAAGLLLRRCRYTRGSFLFPKDQPFPHTSFREEVCYLEKALPDTLCFRKASVLPSKTPHSWHVYTAAAAGEDFPDDNFTVEVCMTQLDRVLARRFFRRPEDENSGDVAGKEMTKLTGIDGINPCALICDFAFDPCGYSMNGIDGNCYSTIHVTPEDGYSYASFECDGGGGDDVAAVVGEMLEKVARVFRPGCMSVSVCVGKEAMDDCCKWSFMLDALKQVGICCRGTAVEDFPGAGKILYKTFTARRK